MRSRFSVIMTRTIRYGRASALPAIAAALALSSTPCLPRRRRRPSRRPQRRLSTSIRRRFQPRAAPTTPAISRHVAGYDCAVRRRVSQDTNGYSNNARRPRQAPPPPKTRTHDDARTASTHVNRRPAPPAPAAPGERRTSAIGSCSRCRFDTSAGETSRPRSRRRDEQ